VLNVTVTDNIRSQSVDTVNIGEINGKMNKLSIINQKGPF